jgi:hypothetical protein
MKRTMMILLFVALSGCGPADQSDSGEDQLTAASNSADGGTGPCYLRGRLWFCPTPDGGFHFDEDAGP